MTATSPACARSIEAQTVGNATHLSWWPRQTPAMTAHGIPSVVVLWLTCLTLIESDTDAPAAPSSNRCRGVSGARGRQGRPSGSDMLVIVGGTTDSALPPRSGLFRWLPKPVQSDVDVACCPLDAMYQRGIPDGLDVDHVAPIASRGGGEFEP